MLSLESEEAALVGLDYRLKSHESLMKKIQRYVDNEEMSVQDAVNEIHDVLRYTFYISDDQYTQRTKEILACFREKK